jgi:hypothetical protein
VGSGEGRGEVTVPSVVTCYPKGSAPKQWRTKEFFRAGSTNSVEDRGERERGSGSGDPLVRGSTQFENN